MSTIFYCASVSEALKQLNSNGYTYDFNLNPEEIILHPENYIINEIYYYKATQETDYKSAVYGIINKFGLKGVFVKESSVNSEDRNALILNKLEFMNENEPYM